MLQAKKRASEARVETSPAYRKHLDYLYARRSTIDALIESLRAYEHSRSKDVQSRRRKLA
jgi:hypothetical protein